MLPPNREDYNTLPRNLETINTKVQEQQKGKIQYRGVLIEENVENEFLKSLAEGGFQVGEFAKLCYGISAKNMITSLDAEVALNKTEEHLKRHGDTYLDIAGLKEEMGDMDIPSAFH